MVLQVPNDHIPECACAVWANDLRVGFPNGHHARCDQQPDRELAEQPIGQVYAYWRDHYDAD